MTNAPQDTQKAWEEAQDFFRSFFGTDAYRKWIAPLSVYEYTKEILTLAAPSTHICDCVREHYAHSIRSLWNQRFFYLTSVKVINTGISTHMDSDPKSLINSTRLLEKNYQFDTFIVGKSNELAFSAVKRIAEHTLESPLFTLNPLFIYGGVGLGKTHLMHALCWHIANKQPAKQFIYMSAERFMYHFVSAIRTKSTIEFRRIFRSVDILMVDDIQFIAGKDSTQEEFFHTFNTLIDQQKHIIISADKSPSELGLEERIRSRLGCGLVAHVYPATYELRLCILENKAEITGTHVPQEALELLANKITSSIRELEGALNSIIAFSTLIGKPITMELVHESLQDLLQTQSVPITIQSVQKYVATHFNISMLDLLSSRRLRSVARPRQIAMYLCRELTQHSSTDIGNLFGGRDHTTVVHAVKTVLKLKEADPSFAHEINVLKRALRA